MDKDILDMSRKQYLTAIDVDSYDKNEKGKIVLLPTDHCAAKKNKMLTSNIDLLEERLKTYKQEQVKVKEDVKKPSNAAKAKSKKKRKKEKESILKQIFNNAEAVIDEDLEEELEDEYKDNKPRKGRKTSTQKGDKLDTTYGQRFSPVISLLYDAVNDFEEIAISIETDLDSAGPARTRYRSDQMGNLISAKNSKLSAIKELGSLSRVISDLEYKKEKEKDKDSDTDSTKALNSLGIRFLKGTMDDEDKKKKKKEKEKKTRNNFLDDSEDDDYDEDFKVKKKNSDKELAGAFAKSVFDKKKDITLSPHERHIEMEGRYTIAVIADGDDIEGTWRFAALDLKGKEIKDFKDDYKELLPKKKGVRMVFDLNKMKAVDKNTTKGYKMILK